MLACRQVPPTPTPAPAPTETPVSVQYPGTDILALAQESHLLWRDADGRDHILAQTGDVTGIAWFPDGQSLVYTENRGQDYALQWVNLAGDESATLTTWAEAVRAPRLSADGHYLSVIAGSDQETECAIDRRLLILTLDENRQVTRTVSMTDFNGFPQNGDAPLYPVSDGNWLDGVTISLMFQAKCPANSGQVGFIFDAKYGRLAPIDLSP